MTQFDETKRYQVCLCNTASRNVQLEDVAYCDTDTQADEAGYDALVEAMERGDDVNGFTINGIYVNDTVDHVQYWLHISDLRKMFNEQS